MRVRNLFFSLSIASASQLHGQVAATTVHPKLADIVGNYVHGDGLGYNISLHLLSNGRYTAEWRGCIGIYGTALGTWKPKNDLVLFSPKKETGNMKGHLKQLSIVKCESSYYLVPDPNDDDYKAYGICSLYAYCKVGDKRIGIPIQFR